MGCSVLKVNQTKSRENVVTATRLNQYDNQETVASQKLFRPIAAVERLTCTVQIVILMSSQDSHSLLN